MGISQEGAFLLRQRGFMKHLLGVLMLGVAGFGYSQTSQQPFNITVSAEKSEVKSGDDVGINIVMTNLSQRDFSVFRSPGHGHAELFYTISVFDNEGKARPITTYGDGILNKGARSVSRILTKIMPGEKLEEDTTISDLFDMKSAGTYKVIVKRRSPIDPNIFIQSNEISITVTD
jgi:hypothetical protein